MKIRTRFAPSPTGPLHLGHAYSALLAYEMAQKNSGDFLLRIEDIDQSRARPQWERQIYEDLHWLGLDWPTPVLRQSDRLPLYRAALKHLWARGLLYPCTCNRRDIAEAANAPQEGAPLLGPDGIVYPGTCRHIPNSADPLPETALRLNSARALAVLAHRPLRRPLCFTETGSSPTGQTGQIQINPISFLEQVGDIVISRRDMGTSYHLSVVLDDAAQHITHVTRGQDLFEATYIHVLLQQLLHLPTPIYHHHGLIRDENGKRLAKRDDARAIARYRAEGATPDHIRHMVNLA